MAVGVRRAPLRLLPDAQRVIAKPYLPGEMTRVGEPPRAQTVVERILALPDSQVSALLAQVRAGFGGRHRDLDGILAAHCRVVEDRVGPLEVSEQRRLLVGAYFTHEYAIEAASLSNPSIVPAPDQSGLAPGQQRFVLSLRAIGEGHISSIELRSGVVQADGTPRLDPLSPYTATGQRTPAVYEKELFAAKLAELEADPGIVGRVLDAFGERFTLGELEAGIAALDDEIAPSSKFETVKLMHWLASSNYVIEFPPGSAVSERVLFPAGPNESHGMEDARFVRFVDDDGTVTYFATYTAFDGFNILPQLIETADFRTFRMATLNGPYAQNKGIAVFPRRIGGRFAALSRHDRESLFLMTSDNVRFWYEAVPLHRPTEPWELMQIGNCGSPLETEAGWLVITHGVGPMRRYTLGALLLDRDDPRKVIGHLREPLLAPDADDREGYVPNVLYSCGALLHGDHLVLPYGFSDLGAAIALVPLDDLLGALLDAGPGEPVARARRPDSA